MNCFENSLPLCFCRGAVVLRMLFYPEYTKTGF